MDTRALQSAGFGNARLFSCGVMPLVGTGVSVLLTASSAWH